MNNPLIIYLAHLDHTKTSLRIAVPLNIGCIASYCKSQFNKDIEISLFTDAEDLMENVRSKPPHILGLSFYMWNVALTKKVIEVSSEMNPDTITVIGGPSVSRISKTYKELLKQNPGLDIVSLDHGEKTFSAIISRILSVGMSREKVFDTPIDGCVSRLYGSTDVLRGSEIIDMKGLENTPSPYLEGYLDKFVTTGQWPMIETNRGCPYFCTFCERGDVYFNKLMIRDEDTIYEELKYLANRSKVRELIITDSNFGLLGERDLRIIQKMEEMHHSVNFPSLITDVAAPKAETKYSIEVMKAVSRVSGRYYYGLQTLTDLVLEKSKRKNISLITIERLARIARESNTPVSVDLIFGLPGETIESFMETTSSLIGLGIQPSIYNLRVLPGTEIAEVDREKYNYKTMFRPFNNRFGEYRLTSDAKPSRIIETEEIAYQNNSVSSDDFMFVRKYGFLIELLSTYAALTDALIYLGAKGITVEKINGYILKNYNTYPRLAKLFEDYEFYSNRELSSSEDDLRHTLCQDDSEWENLMQQKGRYFKINLGFVGYCLLGDVNTVSDFESLILDYVRPSFSEDQLNELNEVFKVCRLKRVIQKCDDSWDINRKLNMSQIKENCFYEESLDYSAWSKSDFKTSYLNLQHDKFVKKNYRIPYYGKLTNIIKNASECMGYSYYEEIVIAASPRALIRRETLVGENSGS